MDEIANMLEGMRTRIFDLLKEQKVSQKELAEKLQILPQTITDWKKGNSNSFTRYKDQIAEMLHTTSKWLFTGEGIKYVPDECREKILEQEREKTWTSLIRTDLQLVIDRIPDEKLNTRMLQLFEKLIEISPEDMDLLDGIMRVIIARREHLSGKKEKSASESGT